jgi:hypothetical protein
MPVPPVARHSARIGQSMAGTTMSLDGCNFEPSTMLAIALRSPLWSKSRGCITPRLDDFRRTAVDAGGSSAK